MISVFLKVSSTLAGSNDLALQEQKPRLPLLSFVLLGAPHPFPFTLTFKQDMGALSQSFARSARPLRFTNGKAFE